MTMCISYIFLLAGMIFTLYNGIQWPW